MIALQVRAQVIEDVDGSFGLSLYLDNNEVRRIRDITRDFERISALCDKINCLGISKLHIDDVIEDFIG